MSTTITDRTISSLASKHEEWKTARETAKKYYDKVDHSLTREELTSLDPDKLTNLETFVNYKVLNNYHEYNPLQKLITEIKIEKENTEIPKGGRRRRKSKRRKSKRRKSKRRNK